MKGITQTIFPHGDKYLPIIPKENIFKTNNH